MDALAARLGHLGISRHYFLLVAIGGGKGTLTQQELADLLEVDKVSMVGILDHLAEVGFINREPSRTDRRKHLIVLTPKAQRALPEIRRVIAELNRKALSAIPSKLAASFPEALMRMRAELEKSIREAKGAADYPSGGRRSRVGAAKTAR